LRIAGSIQQDVRGFHVTMDHTGAVSMIERISILPD